MQQCRQQHYNNLEQITQTRAAIERNLFIITVVDSEISSLFHIQIPFLPKAGAGRLKYFRVLPGRSY